MATAFTHALVGVALTPALPASVPRLRAALLLAGLSVLPDADVLAFAADISYGHPLGHRGFTHSLLFAAGLGFGVAWLAFRRPPRLTRDWWRLAALLALATASHGVLDALTDAGRGVGFLIPLDDRRFFFPWRPLQASPIGIQAFFSGPAREILWDEVRWVWLPVLGVLAIRGLIVRRSR